MENININSIFVVVVVLIPIVIFLKIKFTKTANSYIQINRNKLCADIYNLVERSQNLSSKLIANLFTYKKNIQEMGLNQKYSCSHSVVSNAKSNQIKYLIKYSNLGNDVAYLEKLDFCKHYLNDLQVLNSDLYKIKVHVKNILPPFIRIFAADEMIPFYICDISTVIKEIKVPVFTFYYVSPAGKSFDSYEIDVNPYVMQEILLDIEGNLSKEEHIRINRNLMTNDLREAIKRRDNFTCCKCGNSVYKEPNLLLEVDHIIPLSKGGKTEASNLQTLCWRCNRKKSNK